MFKSKSLIILFIIAFVIIIAGCAKQKTPVEKMYDVLEMVVASEKGFEEQQDPLVTLEKKENEIYVQIIDLGMKEYYQIVKLSDEAITIADKRKVHMEKETISIKESEQVFSEVKGLKGKFEDPALTKLANELYEIMVQRYQAHEVIYKEYSLAITYDKELYAMFKNKDLPLENLEAQVNNLNKIYKKVFDANENFNMLTEQYNDKKLSFYQKAGLKARE